MTAPRPRHFVMTSHYNVSRNDVIIMARGCRPPHPLRGLPLLESGGAQAMLKFLSVTILSWLRPGHCEFEWVPRWTPTTGVKWQVHLFTEMLAVGKCL